MAQVRLAAFTLTCLPGITKQAQYQTSTACTGGGGGLFTSTNPEVRRVTPTANGRTRVKLVYVVLEAQYQSALTQAVKNINANRSNVCVEVVGYLLEELRDPSNYAAFTKDMSDANVFIGSLIFIEELADKVTFCTTPPTALLPSFYKDSSMEPQTGSRDRVPSAPSSAPTATMSIIR